jgi:hypothetical protein
MTAGGHVGEVGHPQLVRPAGREVPLDQVDRSRRGHIRCGRPASFPAANTFQAQLTHQPLDRAAGTAMPSRCNCRQTLRRPRRQSARREPGRSRPELGVAHRSRRGRFEDLVGAAQLAVSRSGVLSRSRSRWSARAASPHRPRRDGPSGAASPAMCRTWPRWSRSPPTARGARPGARTPWGPPAPAAPGDTCLVWSWL